MNLCEICKEPIVTHQYVRVQEARPTIVNNTLLGFAGADSRSYLICLNRAHTSADIVAALPRSKYFDVRHSPQGKAASGRRLHKVWLDDANNVAMLVHRWRKQMLDRKGDDGPQMPVDITKTVPRVQIKIDNAPVRVKQKPPRGGPPVDPGSRGNSGNNGNGGR